MPLNQVNGLVRTYVKTKKYTIYGRKFIFEYSLNLFSLLQQKYLNHTVNRLFFNQLTLITQHPKIDEQLNHYKKEKKNSKLFFLKINISIMVSNFII